METQETNMAIAINAMRSYRKGIITHEEYLATIRDLVASLSSDAERIEFLLKLL